MLRKVSREERSIDYYAKTKQWFADSRKANYTKSEDLHEQETSDMYPSLPGNSSLWSVEKTQVALAKADALKQEDVSREHHCIDMYHPFQDCIYLS